jgi:hypothetical protein
MPPSSEKTRIAQATLYAIGTLDAAAQAELRKRLSGANRTAINTLTGHNIV